MFDTIDFSGVGQREEAIMAVVKFIHANGDALQGAGLAAGGPKAQRECLQLFCDIASADRLTRALRANLRRLQVFLGAAGSSGIGRDHAIDRSREDIRLLADRLNDLLNDVGVTDRPQVDSQTLFTRGA